MILFLAIVFAAGVPLSLLIDRDRTWLARVGESWFFGTGVVWAATLLFWSRGAYVVVVIVMWCLTIRRRGTTRRLHLSVFDLIALITIGGYALFATSATPWEFDFLTDFGLKARAFWEHGGIDWVFLRTHPDLSRSFNREYPLLLSSVYDAVAILSGGWNDRFLGLMNVAFGAAAICVVRSELAEEVEQVDRPHLAAIATAAMAPLLLSPWIGMADGPVGALMLVAIARMRREVTLAGAVLLGLAACTKQEGVAMIAAAAIALFVLRPKREIVRLWPAIALALPWMIAARVHGLGSQMFGGAAARVVEHLRNPQPLVDALTHAALGHRLMWLGVIVGVVVCWRALNRFVLLTIFLQILFAAGSYLASNYDTAWHVAHSWERVVSQITPILVFVVVSSLAKTLALLYYSSSTSEQ